MYIPIQFVRTKIVEKGTFEFSLWNGLKNILRNIKVIFTGKLVTNGSNEWVVCKGEVKTVVSDKSFILQGDNLILVDTPSQPNTIALSISQSIDE